MSENSTTRKWWALAAVGSGTFMSTVDGSIVNIALKTLQDAFQASFSAAEWVVLSYLLAITCLLLIMGRLGDMIGRRRVYIAGFIIFTASSALCGLSWSIEALIGFRVIQAIGAAMIQSMGTGLLVAAFPTSERGQALGYSGTIVAAGISVGPVLGGFLLRYVGWESIFYVNVPIGIIAIWLSLYALPDDRKRSTQRFDLFGAGLLGVALLLFLLALTEAQNWGFVDPRTLGLLAGSLLLFAGFVWWEGHTPDPMVSLDLFQNRPFSLGLISAIGIFVAIAFNFFLIPFYLQSALGYDAQTTGLIMISGPIALSLTSPIAGRLSDRFGSQGLAIIGMLITALGLWSVTLLTSTSTAVDVILRLMLINVGFGTFQSPNNSAVMGNVPPAALGIAGSLLSVMRTMGQTIGIAIAGAIFAIGVTAAAGQVYDPVTAAPPAALVAGLHNAMLVSGAIALLSAIPAFFQGHRGRRMKETIA